MGSQLTYTHVCGVHQQLLTISVVVHLAYKPYKSEAPVMAVVSVQVCSTYSVHCHFSSVVTQQPISLQITILH